jgi:GNAT superfamily N-acetyltransferase
VADSQEIVRLSFQLGYPTNEDLVTENIVDQSQDPSYIVYVADLGDGRLAGFIHVFLSKRLFQIPHAEVGGLVVDQDFRGKGIGRSLLTKSETWVTSLGIETMKIRSNVLRENALDFYLSSGYTVDKEQRVYIKDLCH